jgi:hypothetical protein
VVYGNGEIHHSEEVVMNNKLAVFLAVGLAILLVSLPGCGEKTKADKPSVQGLLTLIPQDATGLVVANLGAITQLDMFKKKIEEWKAGEMPADNDFMKEEIFKDYQDFVDKTGINPETDLHGLVMAFFQPIGMRSTETDADVLAVVNLKYDKDKLLGMIKEKEEKLEEEIYEGFTIYKGKDDDGKDMAFSFVSDELIALGRELRVRGLIDLKAKGGDNILANDKFKTHLEGIGADSLAYFVFDFPEELKQPQQEGSPFNMDLSKAELLLGWFGYSGGTWNGEIKLISMDEEANKQIANLLNGFKGMAAMGGPEVAELINNVNLTSSADNIRLTFSVSDELLEKLQKKMTEKKDEFMAPEVEEEVGEE